MNKTLWFCIIIFTIAFILASCMGAESKIKIQNNGSGKIFFSYRISQMLLEMGNSLDETEDESLDESTENPEEEGDSNVPLPITKEDFEESVKGTIEEGKFADLVLLSHDPYKVAQKQVREIKVEMTIVGGRIVYRK